MNKEKKFLTLIMLLPCIKQIENKFLPSIVMIFELKILSTMFFQMLTTF